MTKAHREYNEQLAMEFYAQTNSTELLLDYEAEMDSEVREDLVKAAMYVIHRQNGLLPFYADLAACRRSPGAAGVDRTFSEAARRRMNGMHPPNLDKIVKLAEGAGISTQGKFYMGGLGKYTDKHAWCSSAEDVLTTAKARNLTVKGAVKHQGVTKPLPDKPFLARDIQNQEINKILLTDPKAREKARKNQKKTINELREKVIAKHTPKRRHFSG